MEQRFYSDCNGVPIPMSGVLGVTVANGPPVGPFGPLGCPRRRTAPACVAELGETPLLYDDPQDCAIPARIICAMASASLKSAVRGGCCAR
jgi:hypothetical protein